MAEALGSWAQFISGDVDEVPVLVHGGARGADLMAAEIWELNGGKTESHPANWNRQPDGSYDKAAGFRRNAQMVMFGADLCLAFYAEGATNRGTAHCANLAKKAGIEVVEIRG
jgi:hypothetical protein